MSASTAAHQGSRRGGALKIWFGVLAVIAAGIALAWFSAGPLRPEVSSSGLEFRTVKSGSGPYITDKDAALLDYTGTFDDGTVFDSSTNRGQPQPFATGMVFPGFAEAMRKMQEGGRYRFTMPQKLAFSDGPPPPGFPPDSDLTFDVTVQKVVPGGAAMLMGGMGQPPQ